MHGARMIAQDCSRSSSYRWSEIGHKEIKSHHVHRVRQKGESGIAFILSVRFAKEPTLGKLDFEATK